VKQIRKRLTYANVMSAIAVHLLLGKGDDELTNELTTSYESRNPESSPVLDAFSGLISRTAVFLVRGIFNQLMMIGVNAKKEAEPRKSALRQLNICRA
jgi:hypothetical protein